MSNKTKAGKKWGGFQFSLPGSKSQASSLKDERRSSSAHSTSSSSSLPTSSQSSSSLSLSASSSSASPLSSSSSSSLSSSNSSPFNASSASSSSSSSSLPTISGANSESDHEFRIPSGPFSAPDSEEFIKFEEQPVDGVNNTVKAATLEKLVERVTYEKHPDVKYMTQFLLTYRSFTSAPALLDLLSERSNLPIPPGLSEEETERFLKKVQQPIRLRILNLLKSWVNQYTHDFLDDPQFSEDFSQFLDKLGTFEGMNLGAKTLKMQLKKKSQKKRDEGKGEQEEKSKKGSVSLRSAPKSYEPSFKNSGANLLGINPVELARQLTIYESELFRKIKPWEFLNQAWAKKGGIGGPNVLEMIHWSTKVSGFVASEIMKAPVNKKVRVISHFMQVAGALRELNNFNALMEVIAGFENAAVWRLQPFFNEVPRKYAQIMEELRVTMSTQKNNKSIREALRSVDMPCIPYLGMFLTDLTFIEDGNSDLTKEGLINFTKRRYVAQVILEIQQYQQIPYHLNPVTIILQYIKAFITWDDEKLYQVSLQFMPRSAKEKSVKELEVLYNETEKELKAARKKEADEDIDWGPLEDPDYVFNEKDSAENVILDERGALVEGSLPKLIQRLAGRPTPGFMETFLVTWPTFCSAEEFSRLLLLRFNPPNPKDEKKVEEYQKAVVMAVKTRVVNILKSLVEKFSFHFIGNAKLAQIFLPLLEEVHKTAGVLSKTVKRIEESLGKLTRGEGLSAAGRCNSFHGSLSLLKSQAATAGEGKGGAPSRGGDLATSNSSSSLSLSSSCSFYGVRGSELVFAQALTAIHHKIFLQLRPEYLLALQRDGESVTSSDKKWKEGITEFLQEYVKSERFCYNFVVSQVVASSFQKDRAAFIESFILVCEHLIAHSDYCTAIWIMNGLSSRTLRKLPLTWANLQPNAIDKFKKLQLTLKDLVNIHSFRERTYEPGDRFTKACIPPVTTYILNYLARLAIPENQKGLINFSKREGMGSIIMDLMKLQRLNYSFEGSPEVERFIGFQERRLKVKSEVVNRCNAVINEEKTGKNTDDTYTQYLPPDYTIIFNEFANAFLQNHTLFELDF